MEVFIEGMYSNRYINYTYLFLRSEADLGLKTFERRANILAAFSASAFLAASYASLSEIVILQ